MHNMYIPWKIIVKLNACVSIQACAVIAFKVAFEMEGNCEEGEEDNMRYRLNICINVLQK